MSKTSPGLKPAAAAEEQSGTGPLDGGPGIEALRFQTDDFPDAVVRGLARPQGEACLSISSAKRNQCR